MNKEDYSRGLRYMDLEFAYNVTMHTCTHTHTHTHTHKGIEIASAV